MEQFLGQMDVYLQSSLLLSFTAAFLGGLISSLTPCVYPMVPITVGVITNANLGSSRKKALLLSFFYVLGMAVVYAGMGMFASLTGRFFGTINTSPYTFLLVGNIVLILGLFMLDCFQVPSFALQYSRKIEGIPGVFIFGMASGLVAGPCNAPVLGVLLTYVASTRDIFLGGMLLFVFAFGMGTVLMLVGTFSGVLASLPKPGGWMVAVKKTLGVVMLLLAEYFFIKAGMMFI